MTKPLHYDQHPWGDLLYGSKKQLQAIGIGRDVDYPGEGEVMRRQITVLDPRGFKARIEHASEDRFWVSIPLPGRERPTLARSVFASGVTLQTHAGGDEYTGSAGALIAAGLVRPDQMPGQPGLQKTQSSVGVDGNTIHKSSRDASVERSQVGVKRIRKISATRFTVTVRISEVEHERRYAIARAAEEDWLQRMEALPRPAPLVLPEAAQFGHATKPGTRRVSQAPLKLVWSAPRGPLADGPGFRF